MAEVTELFNATDTLVVRFPTGAVLNLEYKRLEVTSNLIDPSSTDRNVLATAISRVVSSWDATYHGDPISPTDPNAVAGLPIAFLQVVLKAIIADQNIDPK